MDTIDIVETLKRCELFIGLTNSDVQKVVDLPSCELKEYDDNEAIFERGEEAKYLYVLQEGGVHLILKMPTSLYQPAQQAVWRTITKGGIFGWAALVPPHIRIGSAVSDGLSRVVCINGDELRALFSRDARLGYEIMNSLVRVIASRVWNIEKLLVTGRRSPFI